MIWHRIPMAAWWPIAAALFCAVVLLVGVIRWAYGRRRLWLAELDEPWTTDEQAMLDGQTRLPW